MHSKATDDHPRYLEFIRISSEAKNWAWFSSEHFRRLRQGFRKGEATDKKTAILTVFGPLNSFKIQSGMQSLLKTLRLILSCGKPLSKRCWFSVTLLFSIAKNWCVSQAPPTRMRIFWIRNLFLSGCSFHPHSPGKLGSESGYFFDTLSTVEKTKSATQNIQTMLFVKWTARRTLF